MFQTEIKKIKSLGKEYYKLKGELTKLQILEFSSRFSASVISYVNIVVLSSFLLLFASITGSLYLNTIYEDSFTGYLIVSGIYLAALLIVILFRKRLFGVALSNRILGKMLDAWEENKKNDEND